MKRCVIIGGAPIENYNRIRSYFRKDDCFIFCDSGLRHSDRLRAEPDLIVGDFDSSEKPDIPAGDRTEVIALPREKDDTDTVYALKEALKRGYDDFLLTGMTGRRIDHTLGNIYMLVAVEKAGKKALMVDDYSELSIISGEPVYLDDSFPYFSLLNITGTAEGITIENARYNLSDAAIRPDYQYGISNEVLPGKTARISVKSGMLLLVRDITG